MADDFALASVDKVEVLTLQDNYVDLIAGDNNAVVTRAGIIRDGEWAGSVLSEHGFSAVITVTRGGEARSLLFDFGFSPDGAARNAVVLGADLSRVEAAVLSHGHPDHFGGMARLVAMLGRPGVELFVHPMAFQAPRYIKVNEELMLFFPEFTREAVAACGLRVVETAGPRLLLGGQVLYLGEIPRVTPFERGMAAARYVDASGEEQWDAIADDSSVAISLAGRGLVIVSGCAHAGIVNTVRHACEVTGIDRVHAVMGGFHLAGAAGEAAIVPTTEALREYAPDYVIPTHCTGRKAIMHLERELPDAFVVNMSGTRLTFAT
jgi:7,8-dihydropterin-6-yl-methyl-4-(beta-D-ribofuranosyl)aminobenzene 5'-phosphate synthase